MTPMKDFPVMLQMQVENDIASGKLQPGAKYTVAKLGKRYKCDVNDADAIVPSLIRKGLVEKIGQKAFAIYGVPQSKTESVFQYAQKSKLQPRTVVRAITVIPANAVLSEKLALTEGTSLYQQVRTRLVDEKVLANQYNYIPYEICPGLEEIDLSKRSFQVTLEEDFHTVIDSIEETYSLEAASRDDSQILDLASGQKVLVVQRMSFSASGMPLVFADIHVNPAQFHYVADLWPKAAGLVE